MNIQDYVPVIISFGVKYFIGSTLLYHSFRVLSLWNFELTTIGRNVSSMVFSNVKKGDLVLLRNIEGSNYIPKDGEFVYIDYKLNPNIEPDIRAGGSSLSSVRKGTIKTTDVCVKEGDYPPMFIYDGNTGQTYRIDKSLLSRKVLFRIPAIGGILNTIDTTIFLSAILSALGMLPAFILKATIDFFSRRL